MSTERQTITLNDVTYYVDSMSEEAQNIIRDVQIIDGELQRLTVQTSIANIAKAAIADRLNPLKDSFEVAETAEEAGE